ncbi:hypothetical protein Q5P01_003230 [Channa striata]|uniref:DNA endonuclease RBBP8 n=1 Tax=Channa striata TaxID=64152 RepID=A0AA88NLR3_CHASR|nr:hypothetical protein Q5P01_003230 [Channa striata]
MSSPGQSTGTNKAAEHFENLWRRLGECHQNALQELEAKVSKLKKERCLDAQRLEVFYTRNQQLKEQNKSLHDAISVLEERLRAEKCERCAILEEHLKNNQDQNLHLITKLKKERSTLEDENRKLHAELQKLKMSCSDPRQASSPEHEEGVIPDSPILPSSLPIANKLKKRKNVEKRKHVRYAELPFPQANNSLFSEMNTERVDASENPGKAEVLVPNTCEMDTSQNDVNQDFQEAIAETCGLELRDDCQKKTEALSEGTDQNRPKFPQKNNVHLSPASTTARSPPFLLCGKRFSEDNSINKAKRKKEENEPEVQPDKEEIQEREENQREGKDIQQEVHLTQNDAFSQKQNVSFASPVLMKPNRKPKMEMDDSGKKITALQDLNASHGQPEADDDETKQRLEPTWSIDPALAISMTETQRGDEENEGQCMVDTDCTWVSHSLLQCRGKNGQDRRDGVSGLGERANDSLDMMFDTTAYGEYKSFSSTHLCQSQPCEEEEDEEEAEHEDNGQGHPDTSGHSKARHPTFAHVAVIRKKDERRKLKGTTCKECEIYYADLPEEEKQKKLSACSRHRFLYIPPCTPENFWEVGFPSTQTCIERGYIREDKNPQARLRRRQPLNALFSPKRKKQES